MAALEFWFEFASTYSYIAAADIEAKARDAGVSVTWRPFLLGPIFAAQGWTDSPFNLYPAKGAYMWRDMERLCAARGLPLRRPSVFPRYGLLAARIATALEADPALPAFVKAIYHANFAQDADISDASILSDILRSLSLDADEILRRAGDPATKTLLRERTEVVARRGVFGAPSFFVGDELFWGSDRLDLAIAAARRPQD